MTDPQAMTDKGPRTAEESALVWRQCICGAWYWGSAQTDADKAHSRGFAQGIAAARAAVGPLHISLGRLDALDKGAGDVRVVHQRLREDIETSLAALDRLTE